jgi:hypothetical protein
MKWKNSERELKKVHVHEDKNAHGQWTGQRMTICGRFSVDSPEALFDFNRDNNCTTCNGIVVRWIREKKVVEK